ncbi:MAG TPA: matrixin family metalloprotease [Candidatus Pacearchaeota archaeon]|nr:matrixin family metalloprotease [Candidatus Pacearchaeota archaeon]
MKGEDINGRRFFFNISLILLLFLIAIYFFIPLGGDKYDNSPINYNFSLNSSEDSTLQFYPNMRFSTNQISYRIYQCPLQKENQMKEAFNILEDKTVLEFYPFEYDEDILITCSDEIQIENGLFLAGEGGPTNITVAGTFNVISKGKILLIEESRCEEPSVALHELLHVLGFDHSPNPNNIMYEINYCDQEISNDILDYLNKIYSIPSNPDLTFEGISVIPRGRYLEINVTIRNNGLKDSKLSNLIIFADGNKIKEVEILPLDIGYGRKTSFLAWAPQISIKEVEFVIDNDFPEIDKLNNKVLLNLKK